MEALYQGLKHELADKLEAGYFKEREHQVSLEVEDRLESLQDCYPIPNGNAAKSILVQEEIDPELFKLLNAVGIARVQIPNIIQRAQEWWANVGSYKLGKIDFEISDFNRDRAEKVLSFLAGTGVRIL